MQVQAGVSQAFCSGKVSDTLRVLVFEAAIEVFGYYMGLVVRSVVPFCGALQRCLLCMLCLRVLWGCVDCFQEIHNTAIVQLIKFFWVRARASYGMYGLQQDTQHKCSLAGSVCIYSQVTPRT